MRGLLAAACAAVLVGLAPSGALACAPLAGSAGAAFELAVAVAEGERQAVEVEAAQIRSIAGEAAAARAASREPEKQPRSLRVVRAFRAPSAPAPSRAPPALA
jgi:hypothetical protein